jgi:hypothetical protein
VDSADARTLDAGEYPTDMGRYVTPVLGIALALAAGVAPAAGTVPPPRLEIMKAVVDRTAHTVDLRLRICFSSGPRALIAVDERRTVGGVVQAARHWVPQGVEPTQIHPFSCRANWRLNWLLERGLRGPGTYTATIRIRDAYARWTRAVVLSVTSP